MIVIIVICKMAILAQGDSAFECARTLPVLVVMYGLSVPVLGAGITIIMVINILRSLFKI